MRSIHSPDGGWSGSGRTIRPRPCRRSMRRLGRPERCLRHQRQQTSRRTKQQQQRQQQRKHRLFKHHFHSIHGIHSNVSRETLGNRVALRRRACLMRDLENSLRIGLRLWVRVAASGQLWAGRVGFWSPVGSPSSGELAGPRAFLKAAPGTHHSIISHPTSSSLASLASLASSCFADVYRVLPSFSWTALFPAWNPVCDVITTVTSRIGIPVS